jgi:hypothetical protein
MTCCARIICHQQPSYRLLMCVVYCVQDTMKWWPSCLPKAKIDNVLLGHHALGVRLGWRTRSCAYKRGVVFVTR